MLPRGALHFPCKSVSFWAYGGMDRDIHRLDRQGGYFLDAVYEREMASICTFIVIPINALPFLVFSPIYHWNRVVFFAGFRMGNMRKRHPREGRKLVNVISHRRSKIFRLVLNRIGGECSIFFYGILHFHIDHFEKLAAFIKVSEGCVDLVIDNRFSVQKPAAKFFDLICTFCYSEYKREKDRLFSRYPVVRYLTF